MRVEYIKEGFGHKIGVVLDTSPAVANALVNKEICKFCGAVTAVPTEVKPTVVEAVIVKPIEVKATVVEPKEIFDISTMDYAAMKAMIAKLGIKANGHTIPALKKALTTYQNGNN